MDSSEFRRNKWVAIWLYTGVLMLIVQVLLGGITRLTGSGLSITEWQPILGAFPPLSDTAWRKAFVQYQQIGQFKQLNSHFTLSDFKSIYFWEWFHREWARLIGLVFIIPFAWFLYKKKISRSMMHPLIILFLLGGLQGILGWVMVKSGLNVRSVRVDHIRLAIHFIAAMILVCYLLWFALKISVPGVQRQDMKGIKRLNAYLIIIVFLQLTYGAFMAGSHAALAAPTWPTINALMVPKGMFQGESFTDSITANLLTIQFVHRGLAYLITILIVAWWLKLRNTTTPSFLAKFRNLLPILVLTQVGLGILAVLNVLSPEVIYLNVMHQLVGMLLLLSLVVAFFLSSRPGLKI